ncbi:MAG TPA: ATP-binding protein [bacterium]
MPRPPYPEVPIEKLRWRCDPEALGFKTTDDLTGCDDIIGQERALRAIKLGLDVKSPGYNIFVAGLTGTGKSTTIKHLLERIDTKGLPAQAGKIPDDICYVHNFDQPDVPKVLRLPAGKGRALAEDMDDLVDYLRKNIPQIFESEEFKKRRKQVLINLETRSKDILKNLEETITGEGFAVVQVQLGPIARPEIFPLVKEKVMPWDQLERLVKQGEFDKKEFEKLKDKHEKLTDALENAIRESRKIEKSVQDAMEKLKHQTCMPVISGLIADLKEKYPAPDAQEYFQNVEPAILEGLERFRDGEETKTQPVLMEAGPQPKDELIEFGLNVVVDNSNLERVPVIIETAPNYKNLFGTIERVVDRSGVWHTDFRKIKAGALLQASGGYLVLNLVDTLTEPGVWTALKRALKNRKLDIQAYDPMNFYSTFALKPEAVEVDVKVVMIGDAYVYQLLYLYDEDFKKIFKVKADFDTVMNKDAEAIRDYAAFVKKICDDEKLLPVTSAGVAEIIEYGVRLAGRQTKISTRFSDIADLLRETQYWAGEDESKVIDGKHIQKAIDEKIYRSQMYEDKIQEMIEAGVLMIDISGKKVGQVNGLSVYDMGEYSFGRPTKITAEVSMGRAGIINVEREADLSGKTHNKGVLIIGGYFRGKYAQDKPLTMSASLAFEQSYSGVDGDSASSTEIYAILSELSGLPLRQDIAVTGSVNQKGEIQPIGGVNQKIEGFFEVCKAKGLTGEQGVIIPRQNVDDLMLKTEVVEAVAAGKFHIYPVKAVDEGIEILTGVAAGQKREDGTYPEDTVNFLVDLRLKELAHGMKEFYNGNQK